MVYFWERMEICRYCNNICTCELILDYSLWFHGLGNTNLLYKFKKLIKAKNPYATVLDKNFSSITLKTDSGLIFLRQTFSRQSANLELKILKQGLQKISL